MWGKVPNPVRPSQSAKKSLIFYIYPYFLHFNDVTAILGNCRRFGWDAIWMFSERLYVYIYICVYYLNDFHPPFTVERVSLVDTRHFHCPAPAVWIVQTDIVRQRVVVEFLVPGH